MSKEKSPENQGLKLRENIGKERGCVISEFCFIFSAFCIGKCNCILYLQMAGQKIAVGSQPKV